MAGLWQFGSPCIEHQNKTSGIFFFLVAIDAPPYSKDCAVFYHSEGS